MSAAALTLMLTLLLSACSQPPDDKLDELSSGHVDGLNPAGISAAGLVWASSDGRAWSGRGDLPGQPQALSVDGDAWLAATATGPYESVDDGRTWKELL